MSDYTHLPKIETEAVEALRTLYTEFNPRFATAQRRRVGANTNQNLSVYKDTRWFKWSAEQRKRFKDAFNNSPHVARALVGYFLEFPKNSGFLDLMDTWADQGERSAIIVAYAMYDGQHILINGQKVILNAGEGIAFHVSQLHEVKKSKLDALWANTMVQGKLSDFT
ncbi:hypothetical protein D3C81_331420 [compost metagenome]